MHELAEVFGHTIKEGLLSGSITSCLRWAEKYRVMGGERPGPYGVNRHPWCHELHDPKAKNVTVMKGCQLGITEVMVNVCLYTLDKKKLSAMYALPTQKVAQDFSNSRLANAMELSSYIKDMFVLNDSAGFKRTKGASLLIRGTGSKTQLRSEPVGALFLDEVDIMPKARIEEVRERTSGHEEKLLYAISTPMIPDEGVHTMFKEGTQEHFCFKCPHCGRWTELVWPDCFELFGDDVTDPETARSYLKCRECKSKLDHETKQEWLNLDNTLWVPFNQKADKDHRSFHISQLYSATVSPKEMAEAFLRGQGSEESYLHFWNDKMGVPKVLASGKIYPEDFEKATGNFSMDDPRPKSTVDGFFTMGMDIGAFAHIVISKWDFDEHDRDLNANAKCTDKFIVKYPLDHFSGEVRNLMYEWQIQGLVIDSQPETLEARRLAREFPGYVWLCQYREGVSGKEMSISDDGTDAPLVTVERSTWMSMVMARFKQGNIVLPYDTPSEYKGNVNSVTRFYKKDNNGNSQLCFSSGGADHYYHAQTYAEIALPLAVSRTSNRSVDAYL